MDKLTKKQEIFNDFNKLFSNIMNYDSTAFESISKIIKNEMLTFGAKLFEYWITENIDTGKENNHIVRKDINTNNENVYTFKGMFEKTYLTILGEVKIDRAYYYNSEIKNGFYPIEEKYPFLMDYCMPNVKELICYTTCINPFELTHEILEKLSGIRVSTSQIQKITKKIGTELIKKEDSRLNNPGKYVKSRKEIDKMVITMDGAMINTYDDWKEVKSGVIYELQEKNNEIYSKNKTYISRIEDYMSFSKRIKAEARRRNYRDAKQLIVIGDGARWIWDLADKEFPFAIKIIDWYHAKEHLYNLASLLNNNNQERINLMAFASDCLYKGEIEKIEEKVHQTIIELNIIDDLQRLSEIHTELKYFIKNKEKMQYKYFESKGFPIGSGIIEGACKQLVQLRLKRNGMKWKKEGAHQVLQIRCMYLSDRWDEVVDMVKRAA